MIKLLILTILKELIIIFFTRLPLFASIISMKEVVVQ